MSPMLKIRYRDVAEFDVADNPAREIYFVFGVRKSGSSILNNMVHAVATMNNVHYVDVAGTLFQKGLRAPDWQRDAGLCELLRPGNLYGGFRNFPFGLAGHEDFATSRKVLMVRDPRDALVSEYFSNAYSHSLPESGQARRDMLAHREAALNSDLQAYVLKMAPALRRTLRDYKSLKLDGSTKLIRYENGIMQKRAMLSDICSFFSWSVTEQQVDQIMGWADIVPDVERPTEFVRKVVPHDHVEKLLHETIDKLNDFFVEELAYFGYS
jgi:hypothetical protein